MKASRPDVGLRSGRLKHQQIAQLVMRLESVSSEGNAKRSCTDSSKISTEGNVTRTHPILNRRRSPPEIPLRRAPPTTVSAASLRPSSGKVHAATCESVQEMGRTIYNSELAHLESSVRRWSLSLLSSHFEEDGGLPQKREFLGLSVPNEKQCRSVQNLRRGSIWGMLSQ